LNRKCQMELATERQLAATATHIHGAASQDKNDLKQQLEDLRAFTLAQLKIQKVEFSREVANLNMDVRSANKDIRALNNSLKDLQVTSSETYQTKAMHDEECRAMRREKDSAFAVLQEACHGLMETKATRQELEDAQLAFKDAHEDLEHKHGQTAQKLAISNAELSRLEQQSQKDLADSVEKIQAALKGHSKEHERTADGMTALSEELRVERFRVNDALITQTDHTDKIKDWILRHGELVRALTAAKEDLMARCDKQEQDLKELDRREKASWDRFLCDRT